MVASASLLKGAKQAISEKKWSTKNVEHGSKEKRAKKLIEVRFT
jgi:hypothetical protein